MSLQCPSALHVPGLIIIPSKPSDFSIAPAPHAPISNNKVYKGYKIDEGRLNVVDQTGGRVIYGVARLNQPEDLVHGDHIHAADASLGPFSITLR